MSMITMMIVMMMVSQVKLGPATVQRTAACEGTLSPVWSTSISFDIDHDADIQENPLELRLVISDIGNVMVAI